MKLVPTLTLLLLLAGIASARDQDVLQPIGPQAAHIGHLWWLMLGVTSAVFVAVLLFLSTTLAKKSGAPEDRLPLPPDSAKEKRLAQGVGVAITISALLLFVLLVVSILTGKSLTGLRSKNALMIEVIGHQWWWEVQYTDPTPSQMVTTANEIHIPVGEPVVIESTSDDVIHSFWAPNIHGKRDLIPGYKTAFWIQADQPGRYRGQCAEFCGLQHAHMAFYVIAEPKEQFEAWLEQQRKPAVDPASDAAKAGQQFFTSTTCSMCHTIRGTIAGSKLGPDLTHVASRSTIAAGTLSFDHASLKKWITDSQSIKPGSRMPPHALKGPELDDLLSYLEGLK
jgi:cytochrome c oxidase subunit 2